MSNLLFMAEKLDTQVKFTTRSLRKEERHRERGGRREGAGEGMKEGGRHSLFLSLDLSFQCTVLPSHPRVMSVPTKKQVSNLEPEARNGGP